MSSFPERTGARVLRPSEPSRWVRASGALWRASLDRVIVSVPGTEELLILTGTAAELWHALAEPITFDGLSRRMSETFNGPTDIIAADLTSSLQELARQGAVRALP